MSSTAPEKILVIEDDRSLRDGLAMNLRMEGYDVITAADGDAGMKKAFSAKANLIIADIMMPSWSGLDIIEELRKRGENVPVLILSAKSKTDDKVTGLNIGADDYMTKPFDLSELIARVDAMLRRKRSDADSAPDIELGKIVISPSSRTVSVAGKTVALSAKEFDLLYMLARSPNQVFSREDILGRIWGWDYEGTERTVDNFIANLRKKIETGRGPEYIRTVPKVGYRWES